MISLRSFTGEFPRIPADKLPDDAASYANNCDFSHGELRPLKGVTLLATMVNTVLGLYTEDGINFLTWPEDVNAVRGPVLDDQYLRVYYTTPTEFRVTQRTQANPTGGLPATSWKAGVPKPTSAPTAVVADAGALPDSVVLTWKFFYEANGTRYQEQTVAPTIVRLGREYTFTAPLITVLNPAAAATPPPADIVVAVVAVAFKATPDNAIPVVEIVGTLPNGTQSFKIWSSNSTFAANNESDEFNGLTATLSAATSGVVTVKFDYGKGFQQTRAFVYTVVNFFNEESAPSDPLTVTYDIMQVPTLTLPIVPLGTGPSTGYANFSAFRVYGSVSGNTGATDYQLIGEVSTNGAQQSFAVNTKPSKWTTLLGTIGYLPPSAGLKGLVSLPNGMLAAFKGVEVWFCESYKPWAWNPENMIALPYGVVGIVVSGSSLVVTTTANPYIINGVLPESMSERKLEAIQGGVAKNAIADCGRFVVYVSNDGLVTVSGGQADITMGQRFFTREDWRTRYPAAALLQMRLAYHDGCLIGYTQSYGSFIIRFDEAAGSMTQSTYLVAAAAFMLPQTDSLYIANGATISEFRTGSPVSMTWRSKEFIMPTSVNYGAIQVVCTGTVTIDIYVDDGFVSSYTGAFTGSGVARLPEGFKARKWKVYVSGTGTLKEIHIAPTMKALKNV